MGQTFAVGGPGPQADSGVNGRNGGRVEWSGGNELNVASYDDDAAFVRVQGTIRPAGGGGGGIAFDDIPSGPGQRAVELAMIHGEQSESVRGDPGNPKGSLNFFCNDGQGEGDANMVRVFRLEAETTPASEAFHLGENQWESLVRQVTARQGGIVGPPLGTVPQHGRLDGAVFFGTDDRFYFARQQDAHDVLYQTGAGPNGTDKAIWASDVGWLGT